MLPSLLDALPHTAAVKHADSASAIAFAHARAAVMVIVDGLGWSNLEEMRAHARFMWAAQREKLQTVLPTTTGAALTSLMTGRLPGEHGLIGYRIRDEVDGSFRSTLSDWQGIGDAQRWQRAPALLEEARLRELRPVAIGRKAHQGSGLSLSILRGAEYRSADTIVQRFSAADRALSDGTKLVYLYVDELDRAAHRSGWRSDAWVHALEELDAQLRSFTSRLPDDIGLVITADHGVVDVQHDQHLLMDEVPGLLDGVAAIAGEPRMRYLYLASGEPSVADQLVQRWRVEEGHRARIFSREKACSSGVFGNVDDAVRSRLGDVIVAADGPVAYYTSWPEDQLSRRMIGQHGGISSQELEIPLIRLGAFADTDAVRASSSNS